MTQFFKQTSNEPYNQNDYEVITNDGQRIFFSTWEEMQFYWMSNPTNLKTVLVREKKKKKGFGNK
jgi:hypothetical protein